MFQLSSHRTILPSNHSGFTLVELIVGMTIFAIGLTGILALLGTTMTNSSYSRHEIVVAGLLTEQMELVKNIRDTNLKNYTKWDKILSWSTVTSTWTGGVYIIENYFTSSWFVFDSTNPWDIKKSPVYLRDISVGFALDTEKRFNKSQLFLDGQGRYVHDYTWAPTSYASYIIVSPLGYTGSTWVFTPVVKDSKNQWYIIDARVIVKNWNNYREYDAKTLITDWVK